MKSCCNPILHLRCPSRENPIRSAAELSYHSTLAKWLEIQSIAFDLISGVLKWSLSIKVLIKVHALLLNQSLAEKSPVNPPNFIALSSVDFVEFRSQFLCVCVLGRQVTDHLKNSNNLNSSEDWIIVRLSSWKILFDSYRWTANIHAFSVLTLYLTARPTV